MSSEEFNIIYINSTTFLFNFLISLESLFLNNIIFYNKKERRDDNNITLFTNNL